MADHSADGPILADTPVADGTPLGAVAPAGAAGFLRELWTDKPAFFGLAILILLVLMAVFAPLIAPYDPAEQSLRDRLVPPVWQDGGSWAHVLGTDHLGRDMLSRIIFGARISLVVGVAVVALAGSFGVAVGLIAGYFGGRVDALLMRFVDTLIAFPGLLLALVILAVIGPSITTVIAVLALNGWMVYARMTRGIVLSVRQLPYVDAAEMVGGRFGRVIGLHILPNLVSPLLTLGILEFARIVLAEAALSFLGLGIQPPATSWGLDVASGKDYLFIAWWLVTLPGLAIAITVLSINLVASWARVTSDPQEREKRFAQSIAAKLRRRSRHRTTASAKPEAAE
ncbi:MAG: ABC transporter permease [Pseudomonadota bacterium]